MSGAATTAEWLACSGIGTGTGVVVLGVLKAALDHGALPDYHATPRPLRVPPMPSHPPAHWPQPRHAAPPHLDETQPVICVQPRRARHAKKAA